MPNYNGSWILDHTLNQFYSEQDDSLTLMQFCQGLNLLRKKISHNEWVQFIKNMYLNHPLRDFIIQEPFTQHALYKSKESGDSVLMDFIFAVDGLVQAPFTGYETVRGKSLYNSLMSLSTFSGLRNARKIIERKIDYILDHKKKAHFLSIPSGNLREIPKTNSNFQLFLHSLQAVDSDEEALHRIIMKFKHSGIKTHPLTFPNFTKISEAIQPCDFIWSNLLLNNMENATAEKIILFLFNHLKPGGELLLTVFDPTHLLCGYIEVCCDWWPVYRDEKQLLHLTGRLPKKKIRTVKTYSESTGSIVFLEIVKNSY